MIAHIAEQDMATSKLVLKARDIDNKIERLERARELFRKNEKHYTEIVAFISVLILKEKELKKTGGCWIEDNEVFEIAGNIHDNPDKIPS